jgi:ArsR family transcriptional regulator
LAALEDLRTGSWEMTTPLHQIKAEFFKTLSHPLRIRVLELLSQREHSVGELLQETGVGSSNLSQQLAVLRTAGLVATRKEGSTVYYSLVSSQIADLMAVARSILTSVLSEQADLLSTLREDARVARRAQVRRGGR